MKLMRTIAAWILVVLTASLLGCASSSSSPSSDGVGGYWDDSVITTKVKSAIYDEPNLKVVDVGVETIRGVVTLKGEVESVTAKRKAEQAARKVEGVKTIKNRIKVVKKPKTKKKPVEQEAQPQT
jgi:osmotically-inducible protein OsmY